MMLSPQPLPSCGSLSTHKSLALSVPLQTLSARLRRRMRACIYNYAMCCSGDNSFSKDPGETNYMFAPDADAGILEPVD